MKGIEQEIAVNAYANYFHMSAATLFTLNLKVCHNSFKMSMNRFVKVGLWVSGWPVVSLVWESFESIVHSEQLVLYSCG